MAQLLASSRDQAGAAGLSNTTPETGRAFPSVVRGTNIKIKSRSPGNKTFFGLAPGDNTLSGIRRFDRVFLFCLWVTGAEPMWSSFYDL